MPQDRKGPEPVSRILEGALRRCGLSERLAERQALARWPDIVGGEIAAHSRAVDLADGVLVLEADHGAWRQEVSLLVPIIIEKFNALCGEGTVTGIRWREAPHTGRRTQGRRDR